MNDQRNGCKFAGFIYLYFIHMGYNWKHGKSDPEKYVMAMMHLKIKTQVGGHFLALVFSKNLYVDSCTKGKKHRSKNSSTTQRVRGLPLPHHLALQREPSWERDEIERERECQSSDLWLLVHCG